MCDLLPNPTYQESICHSGKGGIKRELIEVEVAPGVFIIKEITTYGNQ